MTQEDVLECHGDSDTGGCPGVAGTAPQHPQLCPHHLLWSIRGPALSVPAEPGMTWIG